jgi:XTP/dITP diphosphohydrolase
MELIFATRNLNKLKELQALLGEDFNLLSLDDVQFHEDIPETRDTLEGNASDKAWFIYQKTGKNCFADDTGLEIDALGGAPGVYSARYAGKEKDADKNMEKLLGELAGKNNRKGRFKTVISLIIHGKEYFFEGMVEGVIGHEKKGTGGFGYDPIFYPGGQKITFAEMPLDEKNKISHRAWAFNKLVEFIKNQS